MSRCSTALILSKKGFGEGSLLLTVLDSERGKLKALSFGGALERGSRRAALLSGNLIEGLFQASDKGAELLSEAVVRSSYDYIRSQLKSVAYFLTALEIIDALLPWEAPLESFSLLTEALEFFNDSGDEKFILFYLLRFLSEEGWLEEFPASLSEPSKRFFNDACTKPPSFLHGKNISDAKKREILALCESTVRKVSGKKLKSLELLPPES